MTASSTATFTAVTGEAVVPQPAAAGQLVGVVLQDAGGAALPAQVVSFGEVFAPGQLAAGTALLATVGGVTEAAQVDARTFNADGSVAEATVSLLAPVLAAGQSAGVMLSRGGATAAAPLDLAAASLGHTLTASLQLTGAGAGATSVTLDLLALLRTALANGTATYWERGPLATQARVDVPVAGSYHLVADVTATADGNLTATVQFDDDLAEGAAGGAATVAGASLTLDGTTTTVASNLVQFQYEDLSQVVGTGSAGSINVQHDVAALERTGAVADYDTSIGVDAGWMGLEASAEAAPGWNAPLGADGLTQYMPQTGGRADIGPTTQGNAAWLLTQDPTAAAYALGQARAAAGIPWHFAYDGGWLDTRFDGDIWTDLRGGPAGYTAGLTQQMDQTNNGWTPDQAHQPDLDYDAFLLTGDRFFLDQLNAQAAFSVTEEWPGVRLTAGQDDNLINGSQIRGAAWNLREVDEAAWANPAGSTEGTYFAQVAADNWSWLMAQLPSWTAAEGQSHGWIPGNYTPGGMSPWQQDYFASTAVAAAEHGNADAVTFLKWAANFEVGRFLNAAAGFNPSNGVAYELGFETVGGAVVSPTSWAQMQADTAALGGDNGAGWSHSDGDYTMLALQALAGYVTVLGSPDALRAYGWLLASGAPHSDLAALQDNGQLAIAPRLADGNLLTRADVTVRADSGPADVTATGADAAIIETGAGDVTLRGGAGTSVLYAGAGRDVLLGGSGADSLFGGTGATTLSGGAGGNVLDVGTGVATILLSATDAASDRVVGFRPGTDQLVITMATGALTTSQATALASAATTDADGNAVLLLSPGHTVTLVGIATASLPALLAAGAVADPASGGANGGAGPGTTGGDTVPGGTGVQDGGSGGGASGGASAGGTIPGADGGTGGASIGGGTGGGTVSAGTGTTDTTSGAAGGASVGGGVSVGGGTSVGGGVSIGGGASVAGAGPVTGTASVGGATTPAAGVTYVLGATMGLVTAPQGAATVTDPTDGPHLISSLGNDTIMAGSGWDTVFAAGASASVTGGGGHLVFVAGGGQYSVDGGAGSATLYGGSGSSTLRGGVAGGNVLVAGTGNATLASGNGDLMFGGPGDTRFTGSAAGHDLMVGGAGRNSFAITAEGTAFGGGTLDVFDVTDGGGGAIIVGGAGQGEVLFGAGHTTAFAGTGADGFTVRAGAGGTDGVVGFKSTDHLVLQGYTSAEVAQALGSARSGGFGTALSLSDGSTVTLWGVQGLGAGQVVMG